MHSGGIVQVFARAKTDEAVVRFGVLLFHEVHVVGGDDLRVGFACQVEQHLVYLFLGFIHLGVSSRFISLMSLNFNIIIIAKKVLEPQHRLPCAHHVAVHDLLGQFATQTGRAADEALVVFLQ